MNPVLQGQPLELLDIHPHLTRLYTTLSPEEMVHDPLFHENRDLPDASNIFSAIRVLACDGPDWIELDDGRRLAVARDGTLPTDMPWALLVSEVPERGAPVTLADGVDAIEDARRAWNAEQGLDDDSGCNCRARKRHGQGLTWMALILGFAWVARGRRQRVT